MAELFDQEFNTNDPQAIEGINAERDKLFKRQQELLVQRSLPLTEHYSALPFFNRIANAFNYAGAISSDVQWDDYSRGILGKAATGFKLLAEGWKATKPIELKQFADSQVDMQRRGMLLRQYLQTKGTVL